MTTDTEQKTFRRAIGTVLDNKTGEGWAYPPYNAPFLHFFTAGKRICACQRWGRGDFPSRRVRFFNDSELALIPLDEGAYAPCLAAREFVLIDIEEAPCKP